MPLIISKPKSNKKTIQNNVVETQPKPEPEVTTQKVIKSEVKQVTADIKPEIKFGSNGETTINVKPEVKNIVTEEVVQKTADVEQPKKEVKLNNVYEKTLEDSKKKQEQAKEKLEEAHTSKNITGLGAIADAKELIDQSKIFVFHLPKEEKKVRFNIFITPSQARKLEVLCNASNVKPSKIIGALLDQATTDYALKTKAKGR